MKAPLILAIETSAPGGGVALLRGPELLASQNLGPGQRQAQSLLPVVRDLFENLPQPRPALDEIDAVAVSRGPGSYTGTRLGVMAAKALAYALGRGLVAVSSLAALARGAWNPEADGPARVAVVQPSRRDEVYFAVHQLENPDAIPLPLLPEAAISPDEALAALRQAHAAAPSGEARWILTGGGVSAYTSLWEGSPADISLRPELTAAPAEAVGRLALARWMSGERDDVFALQPEYLRRAGDPGWRTDALIQP